MCGHAGLQWGGELGGRDSLTAWERAAAFQSRRAALWVVRFVLCFPLICIVVVTVPLVCCSVKLPLSQPTGFCLFLSILLRPNPPVSACFFPFSSAPWRGEWRPRGAFVASRSQTITLVLAKNMIHCKSERGVFVFHYQQTICKPRVRFGYPYLFQVTSYIIYAIPKRITLLNYKK